MARCAREMTWRIAYLTAPGQFLGSGTSSEEVSVATCLSGRLYGVDSLEEP